MARTEQTLSLSYRVVGDISALVLPSPTSIPQRQDNLWQTTCFECFFAPAQQPHYWEVNLSPSGDWNLYRFSRCRQGQRPETQVAALPYKVCATPTGLEIKLEITTVGLALDGPVRMAIAAVTESQTGTLDYWAIVHPASTPDFHHPDSFVLWV